MTQVLINTLAALTILMIAGAALADPKNGHNNFGHNNFNQLQQIKGNNHNNFNQVQQFKGHHNGSSSGKSFQQQFGKSFSHGFYFQGRSHNHWTYSGYSSKFGCICYWCPHTHSYYYWSQSAGNYYPLSYIGFAPPQKFDPRFGSSPGNPPPGVPDLPR